jgi:hypothetical protein
MNNDVCMSVRTPSNPQQEQRAIYQYDISETPRI